MKLTSILIRGTLAMACLLLLASCANTNTPVSQAIGAQIQMRAATPLGALGATQRTGMQEFFARGGAQ